MKRYLIDKTTLLWWLNNDKNLGENSRSIIEDGTNQILVSVITILELSRMVENGRLTGVKDIRRLIEEEHFEVLSVDGFHSEAAGKLGLADIAISMVASQVQAEGAVIITAEPKSYSNLGIRVINAML